MSTVKQHPLGSGFTAATSAHEVLDGVDLTGTNVVVTGGNRGLGLETARVLSRAGASVTIAARDPRRAAAAVAGMERVEVGALDLLDPASIDAFTTRWLESERPLHTLINNAHLPPPKHLQRDERGYEVQFATNHLGHFQLTLGLELALRAGDGARVINLSSGAQRYSDIVWEDLHFERRDYDPMTAYAQSKCAAVLFAVELDRRWAAEHIHGYAVHPGVIIDSTTNSRNLDELRAMGLVDEHGQPIIAPEYGRKTLQQGVATIVFGAVSPLLTDLGGVYLKDCDVSPLAAEYQPMTTDPGVDIPSDVAPHAIDPQSAHRLWELSLTMLTS
jgi:NAD(P)-dependent dehydrogenase (short-subunit alcohol dehydrogenase family)